MNEFSNFFRPTCGSKVRMKDFPIQNLKLLPVTPELVRTPQKGISSFFILTMLRKTSSIASGEMTEGWNC